MLEAIRDADRIMICPSNPLISIGPILAVPGIREALRARRANVVAVCPIVGGKSLKGPIDKMLAQLGHEPPRKASPNSTPTSPATFVIDPADKSQAEAIGALGMNVVVIPTVMQTRADKRKLARALLAM